MNEPNLKKNKTIDRRTKYIVKMKGLGFKKIQVWVHENDRSDVIDFIDKLRVKRVGKS